MRCGVVWGGEGRWINETGYNVLPFLNVSLHCFDEQNWSSFALFPKEYLLLLLLLLLFGLGCLFVFSVSQSWLQNCRSSCLLNVSMYTTSFGRCCGVSLSLCFSVRQLVCIILVFLFFKFLSVLVRPRPNVEPLRWIPSTVPEVRTAVQNFIIISLGGYT